MVLFYFNWRANGGDFGVFGEWMSPEWKKAFSLWLVDWVKHLRKGKVGYDNRHRMTSKEWNFWSIDYRLKKNQLLVITPVGEDAMQKLRNTLSQKSEESVRQFGRDLHDLCAKDADGKSAFQKLGDKSLNSVEVNALWTIWREFSGQRSENEGIDFIIE